MKWPRSCHIRNIIMQNEFVHSKGVGFFNLVLTNSCELHKLLAPKITKKLPYKYLKDNVI